METYDYKKDLEIDENSLDREFTNQPFLYMKYSELSAMADREVREAKENMEIVAAQVYRDVVEDSEKKPTDKWIQSKVSLDTEYQKAQKIYVEKKYEADLLSAAVKAFDHKKASLENLTKLWIGSYYSTPKQTTESNEMVEDKRIQRQRERLNRKSKGVQND